MINQQLIPSHDNFSHPQEDQIQTYQSLTKSDLLRWVSVELNINVNKLERFQSGTLFLLLLVKIYGESHPNILNIISKQSNLKAKSEVEFMTNYKLIIKIFQDHQFQIQQSQYRTQSDLEKVWKGKINETQDLLFFIRKLWDLHSTTNKPTLKANVFSLFPEIMVPGLDKDLQRKSQQFTDLSNKTGSALSSGRQNMKEVKTENKPISAQQLDKILFKSSNVVGQVEAMLTNNVQLQKENQVQMIKTKVAEKERDFYFGKLRDIELLLAEGRREPLELIQAIQKVLYAKEDENIEVDEDGNILI